MNYNEKTPRRKFFRNTAAGAIQLTAGVSMAAAMLQSFSAEAHPVSGNTTNGLLQSAANEKEFRMGVIGPAELSKTTSEMAVNKATNKNAKEFAGFELTEAIAVTTVLIDLKTPVPPMDAKATATVNKLTSAAAGPEFDKAYIQAQVETHEFLRDWADNYLKNSTGKTDPAESQTRHLATLALATFKEHVILTKRILSELG